MKNIQIAPSLMCADPLNLQRDMDALEAGGADLFHIDVMDGHFVPNLAISLETMKEMAKVTRMPLDVHLMAENPMRWLAAIPKAERLAVHLEATHSPLRLLRAIRERGMKAGIVLNPATPLALAYPVLGDVDFVLLMAVEPGFSGQTFMPSTLRKIAELAERRTQTGAAFEIEVDGGLTNELGCECLQAGADILVAGALCLFSGAVPLLDEMRGLKSLWRRDNE